MGDRGRTMQSDDTAARGFGRRRFLGYVLAAPTLVVAAQFDETVLSPDRAAAAGISVPEPSEIFDLTDMLTTAALPTSGLISIQLNADGTASFALPRAEVGQGITTSSAMLIAEELDIPLADVRITLADARPELLFNQLTGASNTTVSTYTPIRVAAATARQQLLAAAAAQFGVPASTLTTSAGVVSSPSGQTATYGSLAVAAASVTTIQVAVTRKEQSDFTVIGTAQNRIDALSIVTGQKQFAMDLSIPGALPTMVCRPPTINGTVVSVQNLAAVRAMPGVTDTAVISTGVAVRAATFGQCIDAIQALEVTWGPGTEDDSSDATVLAELQAAQLPFAVPPLNLLAQTVEGSFNFAFASNSALEPNCAIADVQPDQAVIWGAMKSPIVAQGAIAAKLGLPTSAVTVHVTEGGGSFGRKLFFDAALEAAEISQAVGKPVKLMWHRTDEFRQGRTHPMSIDSVRATCVLGEVLSFEQVHTSVATDFSHGLGEVITAMVAKLPVGDIGFSETIFELSQQTPYGFGVTTQLLNEVDKGFNTGSMRNIYSPNVRCAQELIVDQLASVMGQDPYEFRRSSLTDPRAVAVLEQVAQLGSWGRTMAPGTAQGIAVHPEYHSVAAMLVEIDCTPATVNRQIANAFTGPRVTKVVCAVDVGLAVNPLGLQAQMMGGIMDGIAVALSSSLHLDNGTFQEGSWDHYFYTRQWNTPPELQIVVMPSTSSTPGGAGELAVASAMAAVACAYARATGTMPTSFPINHSAPLAFTPLPTTPSIPQSPVDGLSDTF